MKCKTTITLLMAFLFLLVAGTSLFIITDEAVAQQLKDRFSGILVDHDADINGDLDVDGTTNLDVVDIDGAIDFGDQAITNGGAAQFDSTMDVDGAVTLNSTLDVDGNLTSGTGAITATDNVAITGTLDVDGAVTLNSTLDVDGNLTSGTGAITATDNVIITGQADAIQLTVTGYTTQTSDIAVFEQSGGTDVVAISNSGGLDIRTGSLTLANDESINNSTNGFIGYVGGQLWSGTTVTATDGSTITPTVYTVYNLDTAAAVTITLAACTEFGPVILVGDDANTITINDTNIRTDDGGVAAIGQYDAFIGICIDSEWIQIANPTNS